MKDTKDMNEQHKKQDKKPEEKQETKLQELQKQCEEYLNGWKRAQADYQNLMKETEIKQKEMFQYVTNETVRQFLPLVDYFKYAFNHNVPGELRKTEWFKGIEHIQTYLNKILTDNGIKTIKTVGEKFDPHLHEAVGEVESKGKSGEVVEEISSGFIQNGKVIRHAKVKVGK